MGVGYMLFLVSLWFLEFATDVLLLAPAACYLGTAVYAVLAFRYGGEGHARVREALERARNA